MSEVCNLDRENIDCEEFTIAVRNMKNRIDRTVVVTEKCIRAIERYLETRDDTEKPLFMSRKKRRISRIQINRLVKKYAIMVDLRTYKENGEVKTKVGPHTLRHTAATNLIAGDCDVVVVQRHLGHRDIISQCTIYLCVNDPHLDCRETESQNHYTSYLHVAHKLKFKFVEFHEIL